MVRTTCLVLLIGVVIVSATRSTPAQRASVKPVSNKSKNIVSAEKLTFTDLTGRTYSWNDLRKNPATVFVFLSTECPVSNRYTTRLNQLAKEFAGQHVRLIGINSNVHELRSQVAEHARQADYQFPVVKDAGNVLADSLGATATPEGVVLDQNRVIRYRGRIDDNTIDVNVKTHDLLDAVTSVINGKEPPSRETVVIGCPIRRSIARSKGGAVTYYRDVAPILNRNCVGCHRPGEVAPFSLLNYQQSAAWASEIKFYTEKRIMPPWKAGRDSSEFRNERRLSDQEIRILGRWADAGAPMGDSRDAPPPPQFTEGWALGDPDLVLTPDREFHVPSAGRDLYRHFVLPTNTTEDRYVAAVDVRPGNRAVVHHVLLFVDTSGQARKLDGQDGQPGYTRFGGPGFAPRYGLGGWAPGNFPQRLPDGMARLLPAGGDVVIQVHYHLTGKEETDRTQIGIYFAKETVTKIVRVMPVMPMPVFLRIPAGEAEYEMRGHLNVPIDTTAIAITPHMHLLGKDMKVVATFPDGTTKSLIHVPNWDFNWQDTYYFKDPVRLPRGTTIDVVAHYDNSDANRVNPNRPPKPVRWGEQTTDEMCIAFVNYTRDNEKVVRQ